MWKWLRKLLGGHDGPSDDTQPDYRGHVVRDGALQAGGDVARRKERTRAASAAFVHDHERSSWRAGTGERPIAKGGGADSLGALALQIKAASSPELREALAYQRAHPHMRIGEALVILGMMPQHIVDALLAQQRALRTGRPQDVRRFARLVHGLQ